MPKEEKSTFDIALLGRLLGLEEQASQKSAFQATLAKVSDPAVKSYFEACAEYRNIDELYWSKKSSDEGLSLADLELIKPGLDNIQKKVESAFKNTQDPNLRQFLLADAFLRFKFDGERISVLGKSQENNAKPILKNLVEHGYPPAFYQYAKNYKMDDTKMRRLYAEGARLGYPPAVSEVGQAYLSHLAGNVLNAKAPPFDFPKGYSEKNLLNQLNQQVLGGDQNAVSYVANFLDNVVNALPALQQRGKTNRQQRNKLRNMGAVAKAISQDPKLNAIIDVMLLGRLPLNEAKHFRDVAKKYITNEYTKNLLARTRSTPSQTAGLSQEQSQSKSEAQTQEQTTQSTQKSDQQATSPGTLTRENYQKIAQGNTAEPDVAPDAEPSTPKPSR